MTKEKLNSLKRYAQMLKDRLSSPVPPKHKSRVKTFTEFLNRELKTVSDRIEREALEANVGKK